MDLHAWITQQVDLVERLLDEHEWPPSQAEGVRLRCEADRRILARHTLNTDDCFESACLGCDLDSWGLPNTENLNDCPELLDLAHAHGLTDEILAGLDRPQAPDHRLPEGPAYTLRITSYPTQPAETSDVPAALRGPHWKP
ncbi:hypothetical protein [Streptomyces nigrescens]|uniref:Uncharacterized protein n=1 Tax=Streptomyces nigrescens TaxID=1920 RepID=A0A640TEG2_STRNI|nr:hypothetical protein [Streptomyces libani]WAT94888.1 hypothetical protein STRLI_000560 [Streptomyces libani subsp. libani]GFE20035.1 hypothetical protein Sliba_04880 [Streptomyces libani subsp. libani]GGV85629.1 hypothetical protein GCM10010500_02410 [Streptomyces libani subsp. libani]